MSVAPLRPRATPDLLFVAPCLPYPPDRGDRLRWYQMLRFLSQRYRVHFGAVVDPRTPASQLARVKAMCYETCFVAPPTLAGRLRGTQDVAPQLADWAVQMAARFPLQAAVASSARMAACLRGLPGNMVRLADYVDLESGKLEARLQARRWHARFGWRGVRDQLALERAAAGHLDHVLFASSGDAAAFSARAPEHAHRVHTVGNGVDADYFSPHILHRNPYPPGCRALVFAGAMDDQDNAEAADCFARRVFGSLRLHDPALHFYVVGARPGPRVRALARRSGIVVTGATPDVRPYLAHAALVVAPLQHVHGVQNKVLEAMAMQQAVLATPAALAGIDASRGSEVLQAAGPAEYADAVRQFAGTPEAREIGKAARARVLRDYRWQAQFARLAELLAPPEPRHANAT